jgi:DNA-binding response OmpR family regulator
MRNALAEALKTHGYSVQTAENGEKALDLFDLLGADIVLLDLIMPVKEGLETMMELKRRPHVPGIIVMSGGGKVSPKVYLKIAKSYRADLLLEKPFHFEELLTAIQKLEKRKALHLEKRAFIGSSRGGNRSCFRRGRTSDPMTAAAHPRPI